MNKENISVICPKDGMIIHGTAHIRCPVCGELLYANTQTGE